MECRWRHALALVATGWLGIACNFEGKGGAGMDGPVGGDPDAVDAMDGMGTIDDGGGGKIDDAPPLGVITYIDFIEAQSGSSGSVSTNVEAVDGVTYLVGVATKPYRPVTMVTGLGAQWTELGDQCGARSQTGTALWIGTNATTTGSVQATFDQTPTNAVMLVGRYGNVGSVGATVVHDTVGTTNCAPSSNTALDAATYSVSIAAPAGGRVVAMIATRQRTHTAGANLTQRFHHTAGSSDGDIAGLALVDGASVMTIAGTLSANTDLAVVAVDLRP